MRATFRDAKALAAVVAGLVEPFRDERITAVCGIESRGFLLGGAAAVELGVGIVPVRKDEGLFLGNKAICAVPGATVMGASEGRRVLCRARSAAPAGVTEAPMRLMADVSSEDNPPATEEARVVCRPPGSPAGD
ncbi:hypothetical protein [Streptomyces sp. NPDC002205]|uniref:hypothetical protein n=1 Tax=Streptomyces sp. NPDC002205 TaxID=3154411 RepID=UPI003319502F